MSPAMPSSRSRRSASTSRPSRIRSPALSWTTRSEMLSHSGVAYSGWLPTSRYSRAPLRRNTLLLRPQETTRRNRYLATSSGESLRLPRNVHVTPYSFSSPNIRLSIANSVNHAGVTVQPRPSLACATTLNPVRRSVLSFETAPQTMTYRMANRPFRMISREVGPGFVWLPVDSDVLGFREFEQAVVAALTAEAGLLDAAERGRRVGHDAPVDADHAGV